MNSEADSYRSILKVSSLLGSLKVWTVLINLTKNKVIAILLGASGIGVFGVLLNTISLISSFADLGISKSAIRNIAQSANSEKNDLNITISVFRRLLGILAILGGLLTIAFSSLLSQILFDDTSYKYLFMLIGLAVTATILDKGQLAILQGLRNFNFLAKATSIGSILGLMFSIPLIYFFKENGIFYSFVVTAVTSVYLSTLFLRKVKVEKVQISGDKFKTEGVDMIRLGISMMFVSLLVALSAFLLRTYIIQSGGLNQVGYFQAGFQIVSGYFGMIFTTMTIDLFPRLSAISHDNDGLESEVNKQMDIGLIILLPLIVLLLFFMPNIIKLLYSSDFLVSVKYVRFAIFGVIFYLPGQALGLVLLAKNNAKIYLITIFTLQVLFLLVNVLFYKNYGISGLGIGYSINLFANLLLPFLIMKLLYGITLSNNVFRLLGVLCIVAAISLYCISIENNLLKWGSFAAILSLSMYYSYYYVSRLVNMKNIFKIFKN